MPILRIYTYSIRLKLLQVCECPYKCNNYAKTFKLRSVNVDQLDARERLYTSVIAFLLFLNSSILFLL